MRDRGNGQQQMDVRLDQADPKLCDSLLSQDELAGLISAVRSAIAARMDNEPAPDRRLTC
jgi:hypothetical protein